MNIDKSIRVNKLTEEQVLKIRRHIDANHKVEGDLRREVSVNIKRLVDLATYRGSRHKKKLPVRGQRTHCNARTRKGKAIAIAGKKLTPLKIIYMNKKKETKKETDQSSQPDIKKKESSFKKKKKVKKNITSGIAYVNSTLTIQ